MALPLGPTRPPLLQSWAWIRRPTQLLDECRLRYGPRFTIRFVGDRSYVMLASPADNKAVFASPPDLFHSANRSMAPFLGQHSLIVLEGAAHRRHRKSMMSVLPREGLARYCQGIRDLCSAEVARWPLGQPFPIVERMRQVTLDIIFQAIFGIHDSGRVLRLRQLLGQMAEGPSNALAFLPILQKDLGRFSPYGRFLRLRRAFDALLLEQIEETRRSPGTRDDFLARLIALGDEPMSDQELVDELITMLAAGHETSTAALAWAFQWILGDPAVHQRVQQEVDEVVGGGPLQPEHLDRLVYLEACFNEALRLSPVIPIVPRLLREPARFGDLELPAGTFVTPCSYLTHRQPDLFPEPERFQPERFMGRRFEPSQYFPFGGGARLCIGNQFAFYEATVIMAVVFSQAVLRRPDLRPQATGRHGITLTPVGGTPVILERRR